MPLAVFVHIVQYHMIVDFSVLIQNVLIRIGGNDFADKAFESLCFVYVRHLALHHKGRFVNDRRSRFGGVIGKNILFAFDIPADTAHIVCFRQHIHAYHIDRQMMRLLDSFIGVVRLCEAYHNAVMTDNAEMTDQHIVGFSIHHCTDNDQRCGVQRQRISDFFFHGINTPLNDLIL